jgi:drug/metabolite transporter (DMT)-like permease
LQRLNIIYLNPTAKAHIAVLFTNIFFAANFSLVKYISPSLVGPYGLNFIRVGISLILFWLAWSVGKTCLPDRQAKAGIQKKHILRFFLCGLTGVAINQMLFIKGLTMTSTIHASLLMLCTPLLITLFAFWILKEKVTPIKITGLSIGIAGATILILNKESGGTVSFYGDLLIVVNAIAYAIYFILVKPLMQVYHPLHIIRWVFTIGFIIILPFGWQQFNQISWSAFSAEAFAALLAIVFCGTFLAYSFNIYGIRHLGAGVTGSYIYTQPVFVALVAVLFLSEKFTWEKMLAAILIFGGVYMVSRNKPGIKDN